MSILDFTKTELDIIGMTEDSDEYNVMIRNDVLHIIEEFEKQGHSGRSSRFTRNILEKVLKFEPLSPLTGEDSEWNDVTECSSDKRLFQNKRCSRVFKDDDGAYDVEGKVFWEWYTDKETGERFKARFTNYNSRTPVTFPYTPYTEEIEYIEE